jgi:hypothetical protein
MPDGTIPVDWVIGEKEVTAWFWPKSPDSVTVRFPLREWAKIEKKARDEYDGDIEAFVSRVVSADLEEHREVLAN